MIHQAEQLLQEQIKPQFDFPSRTTCPSDRNRCPILDQRYSVLKQQIIKDTDQQKVIESYDRLVQALDREADFIARIGSSAVPEIQFSDVVANGGKLPEHAAELIRERGCVILRGVVSEEQATKWETELRKYTHRHSAVGGFPADNPQNWNLWWTPPQVQIRSHPEILKAMSAISELWHVSPETELDLESQVVYPDRFRIRYPSKGQCNHHTAHRLTNQRTRIYIASSSRHRSNGALGGSHVSKLLQRHL